MNSSTLCCTTSERLSSVTICIHMKLTVTNNIACYVTEGVKFYVLSSIASYVARTSRT